MKCSVCGEECFGDKYPEVIFKNDGRIICECCSIDYEEVENTVQFRKDLLEQGYIDPLSK